MAPNRPKEEMLGQVVTATQLIAANQIGVVLLQLGRRHDAFCQNAGRRAGRVTLEDRQRAGGKGLSRGCPVGRRDLALGVAADGAGGHADL